MKRNTGFTLIELLVVMAIIAILAAIVVPNVVGWIGRARMTRAQAEIESIETSLGKMLTDASRNSLNDLIQPDELRTLVAERVGPFPQVNTRPALSAAHFKEIQRIYTNTFYALLRSGRDILKAGVTDPELGFQYRRILREEAVKLLGTSYLEIGRDPWGQNLYQIWPAPWPRGSNQYPNPIIFRSYLQAASEDLPGAGEDGPDAFSTFNLDSEQIGIPAPRNPGVAFIYSYGANQISGQLVYSNPSVDTNQNPYYDDASQDIDFVGGGDDVNNWDSNATWGRFYN